MFSWTRTGLPSKAGDCDHEEPAPEFPRPALTTLSCQRAPCVGSRCRSATWPRPVMAPAPPALLMSSCRPTPNAAPPATTTSATRRSTATPEQPVPGRREVQPAAQHPPIRVIPGPASRRVLDRHHRRCGTGITGYNVKSSTISTGGFTIRGRPLPLPSRLPQSPPA